MLRFSDILRFNLGDLLNKEFRSINLNSYGHRKR